MGISEEYKEQIQRKILEAIITGLHQDVLASFELPDIAEFVLTTLNLVKTEDDLVNFYTDLATQWPVFENLKNYQLLEIQSHNNQKKTDHILDALRQGNVDEAIDMVKGGNKS